MQVRVRNGSPSSGFEAHAAGLHKGFPAFACHALAIWPCIDGPCDASADAPSWRHTDASTQPLLEEGLRHVDGPAPFDGERTVDVWMPGERVPACKSRTRPHRGEPRPRGKQMRRIAAAPRGLLAPGGARWNLPQGASITHQGEAAPSASPREAAPATDEVKRPTQANWSQALERDLWFIDRALEVRCAPRRFCRRAPSACGSAVSCGSSVPVCSISLSQHSTNVFDFPESALGAPRAPIRSKRAGDRTLSDHIINHLQKKKTMTYASRSCNFTTLIVLFMLTVMPFILLGVYLVPLLLEPDVAPENLSQKHSG